MNKRILATALATLCAAGTAHAASWDLTPYPAVPGSFFTQLWSINDRGVVVGNTNSGAFIDDHGSRTWYAFATPSSLGNNYLAGISTGGVLIGGDGHTGFIDDHGTITPVTVQGASQTFVRGISANGRYVVGSWLQGTSVHGYILDRTTSQFTFVDGRNGGAVAMSDVNDNGVAVGVAGNVDASVIVDLRAGTTTWLDAADGFSQLRIVTINDAGELGGRGQGADGLLTGVIGNVSDGFTAFEPQPDGYAFVHHLNDAGQAIGEFDFFNGGSYNFVATQVSTVPEPTPLMLFASGLLAAGLLARRRRDSAR
jgi:hypothetical protein